MNCKNCGAVFEVGRIACAWCTTPYPDAYRENRDHSDVDDDEDKDFYELNDLLL